MTKQASWTEVSFEQFSRIVVGKSYRFNGRVGRVVEKAESAGTNARGWAIGRPMVRVVWADGRA